jgi:hypothetical protein
MNAPTPAGLAGILARSKGATPASSWTPAPGSVLFTYVDNSNIWIEGQRIQAVKSGLARDLTDAARRGVCVPWSYDFGRLYEMVCPKGTSIGRSILVGSKPPPNDSLWERARDEGFEVEVFDRNRSNKEKQVDSTIVTKMLDDSYRHMKAERGDTAVLVAGDADYMPCVRSLQERNLKIRVVFWKHATSHELRDSVDNFTPLDPYFDQLTLSPT